ncbi:MAG TPA: 4'-phosphopantetheinyl transferase superfamily protein [Kofleriaceae bacterium]|nr:4'-phosphopantetheinyl transferase superfamily protein [Kofleriaceae bacterium]
MIVELDGDAALAAALAGLVADEQARAAVLAPARQLGFVAGRAALRHALGEPAHGVALGSNDRGAPIVPAGWVGSLSHKARLAAALVAPAGDAHIGGDLERAAPPKTDIARRVLTPRELATLPPADDVEARGRAVTLPFSIKEAVYKAIDPYVRRYVGFLEVELDFAADDPDQVRVTSALPLAIEATWREHAGHWLTTARARKA